MESDKSFSQALLHTIKLPGLEIPGNVFLAPMAGYTDAAFRAVCLQLGACFAFTEMVSAEACFRQNLKTLKLLEKTEHETAYGIQLFAGEPGVAAAAVKEISRFRPALIDLNCGCSIPKILKSGSGAALLKEPDKIKTMVQAMKSVTEIPVSIKIRSGWDAHSVNYLEIAAKACDAGVAMITLHPRTRSQVFTGTADWLQLKILKTALPAIPVIGSGDLFTAADARQLLLRTGCDGVMLARGAIGNPFIFRQLRDLLAGNETAYEPQPAELLQTALRQLKLAIRFKGERRACTEIRKQFCAYSRGLPGSAQLRGRFVYCSCYAEYEQVIREYLDGRIP